MSYSLQPIFMNTPDEQGIITQDNIQFTQEVTDQQRTFSITPTTSVSQSSVTWQLVSVDDWINCQVEVELMLQLTLTGARVIPGNGGAVGAAAVGTPPIFFDPRCHTVDALCLNKLLSRLTFSVCNKQWVETDRQPEYFNIIATQFDQRKLNAYGINLLKGDVLAQRSQELGTGVLSMANLSGMYDGFAPPLTAETAAILASGMDASKNGDYLLDKYAWERNTKGYVEIVSNTFTGNAGGFASLNCVGYQGINCPATAAQGTVAEWGGAMTQVVVLRVREYIISPSLANPYAKESFTKSLYTGGYPVTITADFNTTYLNNLVVWNKPLGSDWVLQQPQIGNVAGIPMNMNMYTFKSAKPIPINETQKQLYYYPDWQNRNLVAYNNVAPTVAADGVETYPPQKSTIVTANLSSLPPYVVAYVGFRYSDNAEIVNPTVAPALPARKTVASNAPYFMMGDIKGATLRYGTSTDVLCVSMTRQELINHSLETIGSPEFRCFLENNEQPVTVYDLQNNALGLNNSLVAADWDKFKTQQNRSKTGYGFICLNLARLNLRSLEGISLIPSVNYGTTQYKSLQLEVSWTAPPSFVRNYKNGEGATGRSEMNMINLYKRIRTMPISNQGPLTDDIVEFQYGEIKDALNNYILSASNNNGDSELVYFGGGSFMGNVMDRLKGYAKRFGLASKGARLASSLLPQDYNYSKKGLTALGDAVESMGYGRKRRYGM